MSILARKGIAVWILGSLTFLAGLHVLDGFLWLTGCQNDSLFLTIYPFTRLVGAIDPILYLLGSIVAVFLLWGGTTTVALRNPIEVFLGKVLEDGKKENGERETIQGDTFLLFCPNWSEQLAPTLC